MTNKLRKHFMYSWLREDLYGEYSFYKPYSNRLARRVVGKVWRTFSKYETRSALIKLKYIDRKDADFVSVVSSSRMIKRKRYITRSLHRHRYSPRTTFSKLALRNKKLTLKSKIIKNTKRRQPAHILAGKAAYLYSVNWGRKLRTLYGKNRTNVLKSRGLPTVWVKKFYRKRTFNLNLRIYATRHNRPQIKVKKKDRKLLMQLHIARYFNVNMPTTYTKVLQQVPCRAVVGNNIAKYEFSVTNVMLRSGFMENAYVTSNLIRRGVFLLNGTPLILGTTPIHKWDKIAVTRTFLGIIYARFQLFLRNLKARQSSSKSIWKKSRRRVKPKLRFITQMHINLKRWRNYTNKFENDLSNTFSLSSLLVKRLLNRPTQQIAEQKRSKELNRRRIVIVLPTPRYLEVSYRLFSILVVGTPHAATDLNLPTSIVALRRVSKSSHRAVPRSPYIITKSI